MTNTIPPHYSDRYVQQRYSKALRIVQHLSTSSFQPTKEQKLQVKNVLSSPPLFITVLTPLFVFIVKLALCVL